MDKKEKKELFCYYCDAPLNRRVEYDHFPIPIRHGGKDVVPVCITCHDLKDRYRIENWSIENLSKAMEDLNRVWQDLGRDGRLFIAKGLISILDATNIINKNKQNSKKF